MQDRMTYLCLDCGLRQAHATQCQQCASRDLADLADELTREQSLQVREQRYRDARSRALARMTPAARRAWLAFAVGGVLGAAPLLVPVAFTMGGATAAGVAALLLGGGAGIGALWRHVSPRSLVSIAERDYLDQEVERLVHDLPMLVAAPAAITGADVVTCEGRLHAEPRDGLFGTDALALRLVIGHERRPLDDAWVSDVASWTLTTVDRGVMSVSMLEGVRLDASPTEEFRIDLDDAQVAFLRARGRAVSKGDPLVVRAARLRDGARVKITAHLVSRSAPEGYRGMKLVDALGGPLRIEWDASAPTEPRAPAADHPAG